ncbi:LLM class flavin-dependent oxidoreductase [Promicromonospora sukumoe]|uniref:Alkanesulfonate monooxygenase SsuD/methylene tetrahydromethanopterin reductase-like flavin-dependent oxidoreductase (Luciferase family) n=1 Tax=Promicromonospora sukumoe TaxID=88382 RepID=A0A7W3J6D8_9MICO|nr:LLM class flavin-dependent oxidoreductase [Promicromonospora sukumoe]MBA8807083.1 alkanesulfonate monooxygenase SsuD/methylene tetrahydromethanopterin reductase-like flavin-dependent oxidoreductase (luciferase family) [Promicromonospora sukumoe]
MTTDGSLTAPQDPAHDPADDPAREPAAGHDQAPASTPIVAVALDGAGWHPAAWREPGARPEALTDAAYWVGLTQLAEAGLVDLVTFEDSFGIPVGPWDDPAADRTDRVRVRLDAELVAARVAPTTRHVGLVPVVTVTHTEPFHVAKALATLDHTSRGRAGWQVRASPSGTEARLTGRRDLPEITQEDYTSGRADEQVAERFAEAAAVVDAVRALWDSWEDDAEIRDVATRRFIDRDKVHRVDVETPWFSVRGPSITPRPPQGQPVVTALAHATVPYELAARSADVVFVTPQDDATAASILAEVRAAEERVGRTGEPLRVVADLAVVLDTNGRAGAERLARLDARAGSAAGSGWVTDARVLAGSAADVADVVEAWTALGYDGVRLRPAVLPDDLEALVTDVLPELRRRGLARTAYDAGSLRGLLRLPTDVPSRFAVV